MKNNRVTQIFKFINVCIRSRTAHIIDLFIVPEFLAQLLISTNLERVLFLHGAINYAVKGPFSTLYGRFLRAPVAQVNIRLIISPWAHLQVMETSTRRFFNR